MFSRYFQWKLRTDYIVYWKKTHNILITIIGLFLTDIYTISEPHIYEKNPYTFIQSYLSSIFRAERNLNPIYYINNILVLFNVIDTFTFNVKVPVMQRILVTFTTHRKRSCSKVD